MKVNDWEDFWNWYFKDMSLTIPEVAEEQLMFLRLPESVRTEKQLHWLASGTGMEYIVYMENSPNEKWAMFGDGVTDIYSNKEKVNEEILERLLCKRNGRVYVKPEKRIEMETIKEVLYSVDSRGKTRVSENELSENDNVFTIKRVTGMHGGKMTTQPEKVITKGKVNRTAEEQALLEFNAILKRQRDRGYKTVVDLGLKSSSSIEDIQEALGSNRTTADGYNKPQGAKDLNLVKDINKVFDGRTYIYNDKIDGIRVLVHLEGDDLVFKSRGGLVFKGVAERFKNNENLKEIIKEHKCEVDGEFYHHGSELQDISGACRLDDYDPTRHDHLSIYIFDLPDATSTAADRSNLVNWLGENIEDPQLIFVNQIAITTEEEMLKLHHDALSRGYEGTIIKDASKTYQFGKRNSAMWKLKDFIDEEFEIIGWTPGLRPVEDMVFKLKTSEGKEFEAKPTGNLELKEWYVENMEDLIGQYGTVKFFNYTPDNIPNLPSFLSIRPVEGGEVQI